MKVRDWELKWENKLGFFIYIRESGKRVLPKTYNIYFKYRYVRQICESFNPNLTQPITKFILATYQPLKTNLTSGSVLANG